MSSPRRSEASSTATSLPPVVFYPASLTQRRLWFLNQLQGSTSAYNVPVGLWLYGQLDVAALQRSVQTIVDRHEALRTSFLLLKALVQVVRNQLILTVPITDFSHLPEPQEPTHSCESHRLAKAVAPEARDCFPRITRSARATYLRYQPAPCVSALIVLAEIAITARLAGNEELLDCRAAGSTVGEINVRDICAAALVPITRSSTAHAPQLHRQPRAQQAQ